MPGTRKPESKFRAIFFEPLLKEGRRIAPCVVWFSLVIIVFWGCAANAQAQPKRVLLLSSYHQSDSWSARIIEAFSAEIQKLQPTDLFVEFLDARRINPSETAELVRDYLHRKYRDTRFDVVACSDDPALDFLLAHRAFLFPGIPLVFCGVNDYTPARLAGQTGITGVNEAPDVQGTIELILKLQPKAKTLVVVGADTISTHRANLDRLHRAQTALGRRIEFREYVNLKEAQAQTIMADLPGNTAILVMSTLFRGDGREVSPVESARLIAQSASVPTLCLWDFQLGVGTLGGRLVSGLNQGSAAGALTRRILAGESADTLPVMDSPNQAIIDWKELTRLKLDAALIPDEATIINRPLSLWNQYRPWIFSIAAFIVIQTLLIILLLVARGLRKQAERELRRSEERYRAIFENAVEGFFHSTPEGRFIRVNKALAKMCGYASPEEMVSAISDIGEQHYQSKKDREIFMALLNEKGVVEHFEHQTFRKDGSTFWVSVSAREIKDSENRILYYEGSHVDIDGRKKAEKRLVDAEEQYRSLFDTSTNAILIRNRAGIITMVNKTATALLAAETQEDLIGRVYIELVHPEDRSLSAERVENIFQVVVEQRAPSKLEADSIQPREHRMTTLHGDTIDVESTGVAFQYKGEFFIQGIFRDITARKQAEEHLRETEKKYKELAESLPQVIFEVDLNGTLNYLNQTGFQLFGYTSEEFAKGFNVIEAFIPEDRERVALDIMLNIQGQRLGRQDYTAVRKDGTKFPVGIHASRVMSGQTATAVRGILIDLTATKRAEEDKRKLEIQLQHAQKMETIGALAGGIAHDFNNILSAIIGYTELAMLNEGAEICAGELNQALIAANRAKDLVKQILAFSRQTDEDRMPVRVGLIANEAVKFLRATIPATIEIKTHIDNKSGAVFANSVELHQIIMNLCTNAVHAIGDRGGVLEVDVGNAEIEHAQKDHFTDLQTGSYVLVSVKDTGYGMTPDVMERIFDPYFTTKEKGVGTGLGLAVVHGIVKKSGGEIQVESELGKGTTFHIYLPKVDMAAPPTSEPPKPIIGGSERILFVDDEKMVVDIGHQALQHLGYDVVSRTSPIEALELFKAKPGHFDLVITDQTMPGMTGDVLVKELLRIRPNLPVIICTGYSRTIDHERAKQIGIKAFVMKPILINEIAAAVRKVLDKA